jgi:hypothetical protein
MAWYYELRDSRNRLVFFGGGCPTREKAEQTAQSVKKMYSKNKKLTIHTAQIAANHRLIDV